MIHGLIFDMDGVLLDSEKIYFQCWKQSAKEFGFEMQDETIFAVRSCCSKYAEPYFKRLFGEDFCYYDVRERRRELVTQYIEKNGVQQKVGIFPLIRFCQEQNIQVAVATATSRELAEIRLQMAGLGGVFSKIIGGDDVTCGKPAPDIYQKAVSELGLEPKECAAVEDSPNGIISAFSAGCSVIMVPDMTPPETCFHPLLWGVASNLEKIIPLLLENKEL